MSHLSALVAALGKPIDAMTFGDFGDKSRQRLSDQDSVIKRFILYLIGTNRIPSRQVRENVARKQLSLFDVSLRTGTCHFLVAGSNFVALPENKAGLARFLSEHLIENAPPNKVLVVARGFNDKEEKAQCSNEETDSSIFSLAHQEADTRNCLPLHCKQV